MKFNFLSCASPKTKVRLLKVVPCFPSGSIAGYIGEEPKSYEPTHDHIEFPISIYHASVCETFFHGRIAHIWGGGISCWVDPTTKELI